VPVHVKHRQASGDQGKPVDPGWCAGHESWGSIARAGPKEAFAAQKSLLAAEIEVEAVDLAALRRYWTNWREAVRQHEQKSDANDRFLDDTASRWRGHRGLKWVGLSRGLVVEGGR
jgi:hypothetical protein